jgi:hypothetical protein
VAALAALGILLCRRRNRTSRGDVAPYRETLPPDSAVPSSAGLKSGLMFSRPHSDTSPLTTSPNPASTRSPPPPSSSGRLSPSLQPPFIPLREAEASSSEDLRRDMELLRAEVEELRNQQQGYVPELPSYNAVTGSNANHAA